MKAQLLRSAAVAAAFAIGGLVPMMAQETPPAQASLSVQGRQTVYENVTAIKAKSLNDIRIVVIATAKPLTAKQFEQVLKANAEETQDLEGYVSYIKASFKEDGTLRYLVGDGGGAVFSKKNEAGQTILKGQATINGDRIKGEVHLNEPGDYAKEAKLIFDLPILTEAPAAK